MGRRQDREEECECGACQRLVFYTIHNHVSRRVRLIGELHFLFFCSTDFLPKFSSLAREVIRRHAGFFSFIILSAKDPLSGINTSKDQTINHFFLWNWARVITHFVVLYKGYGWGASTHMIKILSSWYTAIIRAGIYLNGLCHHIAFTVLCQKRNVWLHKQISFFDAGKLLWFTSAVYSHCFIFLEKYLLKRNLKQRTLVLNQALNSELFSC